MNNLGPKTEPSFLTSSVVTASPAAKPENMVEYFTLWRNYETWHTYSVIIFRLGLNSETPPGGRHLEFQYGLLLPITLKLRQIEM